MRLFVAAWPPAEVAAALRSIPRPERAGIRWTPPASWHVTLRFLGEVPDPDPVVEALRAELPGRGALRAVVDDSTSRLGSVLVVRVGGLDTLAALVGRATTPWGDPPRPGPFVGHLTIARAGRRRIDDDLVGRAVEVGAGTEWCVDEVAVVRSTAGVTPGPPTYDTVARIPLT